MYVKYIDYGIFRNVLILDFLFIKEIFIMN